MTGRIPFVIEATIEGIADVVEAHRWAWGGDSALACHGLLRWRDHDHTVTLVSPADQHEPPALAWAMRRQLDTDVTVSVLSNLAVIQTKTCNTPVTATLLVVPVTGADPLWDAEATSAALTQGGARQRVMTGDHLFDMVVRRWVECDHSLTATIDAVTVADRIGPDQLAARCAQLPAPAVTAARERLVLLDATPAAQLGLYTPPAEQASIRLAADRLQQALPARGVTR